MQNASKVMYRSTNGLSPIVDRRTAVLESQPPDGGLYVPTEIPQFYDGEISSLHGKSLPEIGYACMSKFLKGEMPDDYIQKMCKEALNFDIPIEKIDDSRYLQRLGEGPTGAFKDTAARLLAGESSYYISQGNDGESWLLVATSGDTGAAIASAFHNVEGINVIVLYPKDYVTKTQASLMNTYGDNIIALECNAVFDDLQDICMRAFSDKDLEKYRLWSANSIGIGRAQPQIIHAVHPLTKEEIAGEGRDPVYVIPSGNFGHAYAFLLAKEMGAFNEQIVVANNLNNVFDRFMKTGKYDVRYTEDSHSTAMNVNDPSNARRVIDMYGGKLVKDRPFTNRSGKKKMVGQIHKMPDMERMRRDIWTVTVDDIAIENVENVIIEYGMKGTILEPHGAVGVKAEELYRNERKDCPVTVDMETAHIGKFPELLNRVGINFEKPAYMDMALRKSSRALNFSNIYDDFKDFLLSGEAENVIRQQKM